MTPHLTPDNQKYLVIEVLGNLTLRNRGGFEFRAVYLTGSTFWDISLPRTDTPVSALALSVQVPRIEFLNPVLSAWGPQRTRTDSMTALGTTLSRYPHTRDNMITVAQGLFTRTYLVPGELIPVIPDLPDGRFVAAGFTEAHPGLWPAGAVLAARSGDLSLLWPYLDEQAR